MSFNKLISKYKENIGEIKDSKELLKIEKYNPWTSENVEDLSSKFLDALENDYRDFSWLNIEEGLCELESNQYKNLHYGIPNHVRGNIDIATLFLCLVNPNIALKDKKREVGVYAYFNEAKEINSEDSSLNILGEKEEYLKEYIKDHIINIETESSILYQELEKIKNTCSKEDAYYLSHYFAHICFNYLEKKQIPMQKFISNLNDEEWEKLKDMSKLIVNLEAFPFRSKNPGFTKSKKSSFANHIVSSNTKVGMLSARIIIWRIVKYLEKKDKEEGKGEVKPIFIFRRFNTAWLPSIRNVLLLDLKFNKNECDELIKKFHQEFFLTIREQEYDRQSGFVGKYICKNNDKLTDKEFEKIFNETLSKK